MHWRAVVCSMQVQCRTLASGEGPNHFCDGACRARRKAGLLPIVPAGWDIRDPATDPALVELGTIRLVAKVRGCAVCRMGTSVGCLAAATEHPPVQQRCSGFKPYQAPAVACRA